MNREKTAKQVRKMLKKKFKFEFEDLLDKKLDECMALLKDTSFRAQDRVTIEFPFIIEGFNFLRKK